MAKVASNKSATVRALPKACSDELTAVEFMEQQRWGDSPACPRCGATDVVQLRARDSSRNKRFLWLCRGCNRQYTVRIGTVFEDSRIPLKHWCYAFWAACASKKGVSALQIKRQTGLSYKSALFMMHRIRYAMSDDAMGCPLSGVVEVDETYVGGKRPRGPKVVKGMTTRKGKRVPVYRPGPALDHLQRKTPVVAMVERGGRVRAGVPTHVSSQNLRRMIRENVSPAAHLMTDESNPYVTIGREFAAHSTVIHSRHEYARDGVTTNTVEGFFALLKRGLIGTFHSVSRKHLHRYVAEFAFRYNQRKVDDGARTVAAIRGAEGKRLTYRQQVA
jgi:transposase-like protein